MIKIPFILSVLVYFSHRLHKTQTLVRYIILKNIILWVTNYHLIILFFV